MSRLWWLACALVGLPCRAAPPLQLRVLQNGAPASSEPFAFEASSWDEARATIKKHFGSILDHDPQLDWWLATADGAAVTSWEELQALPSPLPVLVAVPSGKLFQWGPRSVGQRFAVNLTDREGVEMETIAGSPRIFLIHNFLAADEATGLIERALERTGENALATSGVGFSTSGKRSLESLRTSASAFDSESAVAKRVLRRSFDLLRVPFLETMADGLQILRYQEGQAYTSHKDWFPPSTGTSTQNFDSSKPGGSNRFATLFLYLWSPPSGGYTVFPKAQLDPGLEDSPHVSTGKDKATAETAMRRARDFYNKSGWELTLTQQCYSKLALRPVQLGAALFYHQDPMTGHLLPEAEHGACPSLTGTKWGANLWLWNTARHLSTESKATAAVSGEFVNDHDQELELFWSTDDGASWVTMGKVPVGGTSNSNTYQGHWWRFTLYGTDQEVRRFIVPAAPAAKFFATAKDPIVTPRAASENEL